MKKILVIDDEVGVRLYISDMLKLKGFEVIVAEDGDIGVELARKHLPDLIICDIQMPRLNGHGVLLELHQDSLTADIPFIFLTALSKRKDVRKGMGIGADDYLTKPINVDELLAAIKTRLEKQAKVLKKMDDLRVNISSILPHEMATPLTSIIGFAQCLVIPGIVPEPGEINKIGYHILKSSIRLRQLIKNYLLYAELKVAEDNLQRKEMWQKSSDIVDTASLITNFAQKKAKETNRQNDLVLDIVDIKMKILEGCLQKVVEELVDNACKFSESDTPIWITTKVESKQFILAITDQGRGMRKEDIAKIGAYMQFDRKQYEQQGSGLGLIIVKLLMKLHGGSLVIKSKLAQGTTVTAIFEFYRDNDQESYAE